MMIFVIGQVPFGGWRHHLCPGGKRVTGFSVAQGLPTNPVPLPPQLRWWDYGRSALCHMTLQEGVEQPILSPGWGKVRRSRIRGSGQRPLIHRNAIHADESKRYHVKFSGLLIANCFRFQSRQLSRRPVFTAFCLICIAYQDSSPGVRMTVSGEKSRNAAAIGGYIILIDAHGVDTTTLGPKGPVKL